MNIIDEIHRLSSILQQEFNCSYAITGSSSIFYYLFCIDTAEARNLMSLLHPHDIDVLIRTGRRKSYNDVPNIGDYKRIGYTQDRVTTYQNKEGYTLDLSFESSLSIFRVNKFMPVNLHNPKSLKRDYEDIVEDRIGGFHDEEEKEYARIKLKAANYILEYMNYANPDYIRELLECYSEDRDREEKRNKRMKYVDEENETEKNEMWENYFKNIPKLDFGYETP